MRYYRIISKARDYFAPVFCGEVTILHTFFLLFLEASCLVNVDRVKPLERGIRSVKTPHQTLLMRHRNFTLSKTGFDQHITIMTLEFFPNE